MNRKIKFRSWNHSVKRFLYSDCIQWCGGNKILEEKKSRYQLCSFFNPDLWGEGELTYQQWTGLLDKNGREIYEGDILLLTSNCYEDQTCQVKFGQGIFDSGIYKYAGFYLEKGGKILESYEVTSLIDKSGLYEYEIIGNIFETPDL